MSPGACEHAGHPYSFESWGFVVKLASKAVILSSLALAVVVSAPSTAWAAPAPSEPIVSGLVGPLQIDVGSDGQIYVGQAFAGVLTKVRPDGSTKDLFALPGEIAGVASRGYNVAFTWTGGDEEHPASGLKQRFSNGTVRNIANLYAFEKKHNPDAHVTYGFKGLSDACKAELAPLVDEIGPPSYKGGIDSHPYAVANAPDGGWYVAEAAGNAILHVSRAGKVSVVSVLPSVSVKITADAAAALGLPACTVGTRYRFEPVPTDVEVGPGGMLYVSSLPGGPEDGSLGPQGRVLKINPHSGATQVIGRGFVSATNVAVTPGGRVYVAELFANQISTIKDGWPKPFVSVNSPTSIDYANGRIYAAVDVFAGDGLGAGSIVTIRP